MVSTMVPARMAAALAALMLTSETQAATVIYDFTGSPVGPTYSLSKSFTAALGPNLTVTANTVSPDGEIVTPVPSYGVGQWAGLGLGLKSSATDNSHTVDGSGLNDLLILAFTSSVKIVSATFRYAGVEQNSYDDFAFFADPDNDSSVAGDMIFSSEDIVGSGGSGYYNFTTDAFGGDYASKLFAIGAIFDALYQNCTKYRYSVCKKWETYTKYDSFKLASVTVNTGPFEIPPQVPLPAGLVLLLSGITGLGFLSRYKNKSSQTRA